jgi:hypothetical protein
MHLYTYVGGYYIKEFNLHLVSKPSSTSSAKFCLEMDNPTKRTMCGNVVLRLLILFVD